jgi:ATP-dependent helicase YprA (DUF1998 family)
MQKMFGLESNDVIAITEDGAPASQKDFVVWNPPLVDPMQPALGRASSISEAKSDAVLDEERDTRYPFLQGTANAYCSRSLLNSADTESL